MAEKHSGKDRAFRGLILSFFFSFINLAGILFTAISLNALGEWSAWQFVGLFGVYEASLGLACVILPNIWHMPVAERETSPRTRVELALSALFLPHWGAIARSVAGLLLIVGASTQTGGLAVESLALAPLAFMLAVIVVGISLIAARAGVQRPDLDVIQISINWRNVTNELPPLSMGASVIQFVLGIITIPAAHLLPTSVLYQPYLAPSPEAMLTTLLATGVIAIAVLAAWYGRISREAHPEQQEEAEANA